MLLKFKNKCGSKLTKKLKTASFYSKFTGCYKKKSVIEGKVHSTFFYCRIMVDDLFVEAINAVDHFFFNGKPWNLLMHRNHLICSNNPCC